MNNKSVEEVGSLEKELILNTNGKIKIRYGRKMIDLLDNDGYLNPELIRQ